MSAHIAGSRLFVTQYNVMDIFRGWMRVKCENASLLNKYQLKATTTISRLLQRGGGGGEGFFPFFNTIDASMKPKYTIDPSMKPK